MVAMWIDTAPEFDIDGGVVVVTLTSGGDTITLSLSRATFRRAVESGKRAIDAADREEQFRVEQLRRREASG